MSSPRGCPLVLLHIALQGCNPQARSRPLNKLTAARSQGLAADLLKGHEAMEHRITQYQAATLESTNRLAAQLQTAETRLQAIEQVPEGQVGSAPPHRQSTALCQSAFQIPSLHQFGVR